MCRLKALRRRMEGCKGFGVQAIDNLHPEERSRNRFTSGGLEGSLRDKRRQLECPEPTEDRQASPRTEEVVGSSRVIESCV